MANKNRVNKAAQKAAEQAASKAIEGGYAPQTGTIRDRAILANLWIQGWEATATDEKITDEVSRTHNIASDMGHYQKALLSPKALAKLRAIKGQMRAYHLKATLPWDNWGSRLLKHTSIFDYSRTMRGLESEYKKTFYDELEAPGPDGRPLYEHKKDEARALLNGGWREADYPTLAQLRAKYKVHLTFLPIPAGEDVRIELGTAAANAEMQKELDELKRSVDDKSQDRVSFAMRSLWDRMREPLAKLVEALKSAKEEDIRQSLLTSITKLIDLLPTLNVMGDPALDAFAAEVRETLAGYKAKDLRENEEARKTVLAKADEILARVNEFMA
jgi:hypothetical protein